MGAWASPSLGNPQCSRFLTPAMNTPTHNKPTPGHTPTPWHVSHTVDCDLTGLRHIRSIKDGRCGLINIATITPANAAFIVRAVNSHEALVAALELLLAQADACDAFSRTFKPESRDAARSALAAARKEVTP